MATRESRHTVSGIVITDFRLSSITPSRSLSLGRTICPRQYHVRYAGLSPSGTASHSGHA